MRRRSARQWRAVAVAVVMPALVLAGGCTAGPPDGEGGPSPSKSKGQPAPVILPGAPGDEPKVANQSQLERIGRDAKPSASSVHYVRMMIPHHQQALAMTALAPQRVEDPRVRGLAERIHDAQNAEIDMMQGWLERHGHERVPKAGARNMPDEHRTMMGMATREEMARLKAASGTGFDRLFLQLMRTHHQGAVEMAVDALAESEDPLVRSMAKDTIATQRDEIATMTRMLSTLD